MTTTSTLAYLAGFFDGEGNVRVAMNPQGGRRSYYLRISATQVDDTPLWLLKETFGGYVYARKHRQSPDGFTRQPISDWVLTGPNARAALARLLPYLIVKKQAAALAIWFQSTKHGNHGPGVRHRLTGWEHAERQAFAEALEVRTNHVKIGGVGGNDPRRGE